MGLETRNCTCGTEFEDSEWSRSGLCDECKRPNYLDNAVAMGTVAWERALRNAPIARQYAQFTDDQGRTWLRTIPQPFTLVNYGNAIPFVWDGAQTLGEEIVGR